MGAVGVSHFRRVRGESLKNYIFGSGGHAIEVAELMEILGRESPILVDETNEQAMLEKLENVLCGFYLGVGKPEARLRVLNRWNDYADKFATLQHENSYISRTASIGGGSLIQFGSVVSSHAVVGRGVLLNWNATIGHHAVIEIGSVINPGAAVSGYCKLGSGVLVGTGARILEGISIGDHAVIGAGAVVTKDVPVHGRFVGVPAREMQ